MTTTDAPAQIDADKLMAFVFRAVEEVGSGLSCALVVMGDRLGYYRDLAEHGLGTILFLDEVHRFNKTQQDALLPSVESGLLTFIGATTENPFFEVNAPLRSRSLPFQTRAIPCSQRATTSSVISRLVFLASSASRMRTMTRMEFEVRTTS